MNKYYGEVDMVAMLYLSNDGMNLTVRWYSINKEMYGRQIDIVLGE